MSGDDDLRNTITSGLRIGKDYRGPKAVVLFSLPENGCICSGFGSQSLTLFVLDSLKDSVKHQEGHGKIIYLSENSLAAIVAAEMVRGQR